LDQRQSCRPLLRWGLRPLAGQTHLLHRTTRVLKVLAQSQDYPTWTETAVAPARRDAWSAAAIPPSNEGTCLETEPWARSWLCARYSIFECPEALLLNFTNPLAEGALEYCRGVSSFHGRQGMRSLRQLSFLCCVTELIAYAR